MNSFNTVTRTDFKKLPSLPLPVHLRSTGHFRLEHSWSGGGGENSPFVQLFWGVEGQGEISINDERIPLGKDDVALMLPGESHWYFCGPGRWELRWFTFDGPGAVAFLKSYGYPRLLRGAGQCPQRLFDEIASGLREMSPFRQRKLVAVSAEILALAGGGSGEDSSTQSRIVQKFIELAQTNYSNSSVNVNGLADIIGVHRTTLGRLFKERMMLSPGEYLMRLRMQQALSLLKDSAMPLSEISGAVGISEPSYFWRCVRRATGMGPREYRNSGPR